MFNQRLFKSILCRMGVIYVLLALVWCGLAQREAFMTNRMNFLKQYEWDGKLFATGETSSVDSASLRMLKRYYEGLLKDSPQSGIVRGNLGFCYFYLKEYKKALEEYQKAVVLEPEFIPLQWDLGFVFFKGGDFGRAIKIWENYLLSQEQMLQNFESFETQAKESNKKEFLILIYQAKKDFRDREKETYIKLSESYRMIKDFPRAKAVALSGLRNYPRDRWLVHQVGIASFAMGHIPEAADYFRQAIDLDPQDIDSLYYYALCMKAANNRLEEIKSLNRIKQLQAKGVQPPAEIKDDIRLRLNTEWMYLKYRKVK